MLSRRQVLGSSVTLALGAPLAGCADKATRSGTLDKVTCVTGFGTFGRDSYSTGFPVGALNSPRIARGIAILAGSGLIPSGLTPDNTADLSIMGVA
jgi:hypothetical protein